MIWRWWWWVERPILPPLVLCIAIIRIIRSSGPRLLRSNITVALLNLCHLLTKSLLVLVVTLYMELKSPHSVRQSCQVPSHSVLALNQPLVNSLIKTIPLSRLWDWGWWCGSGNMFLRLLCWRSPPSSRGEYRNHVSRIGSGKAESG